MARCVSCSVSLSLSFCLLIPELPMKIANHNAAERGKEGILQNELVQDELQGRN